MNKEVIGVELSKLKTVDVCKAELDIPNRTGIYFWLDKNSHEVVYIGVGAGRNGLRNRIVRQHLNPKYIEYRAHKQSAKDHFQLSVPVRKIVKGKMANGIDQSAFRKNIGRLLQIKPGEGTVSYIRENLYLKYLVIEDLVELRQVEKQLISHYQSKFNNAHKN